MTPAKKYLLLGGLYFSQGLPYGFFTQALPTWLAQQGVSLQAIGLSSLLALPWATKILWSPLVDRYQGGPWGPRRTWIAALQLGAIVLLVALAGLDPQASLKLLLGAVLLTNFLAATQDIATDALAVDLLQPQERGLGNGVQAGAYRVGMVVGGGGLLMLFERLQWSGTLLTMAGLLVMGTLPLLRYREPPPLPRQVEVAFPVRALLVQWWRDADRRSWLGMLLLAKAGESAASAMFKPCWVGRGLGLAQIGWLAGTLGFGAALVGAFVGGGVTRALGPQRGLLACALVQMAGLAVWVVPALEPNIIPLEVAVVAEHLASGMATASIFSAMMDRTGRQQAATEYTLQASVVVVGQGLGAVLSGFSAGALGYAGHFALCAGLAAVWAVWLVRRPPAQLA